MVYWHYTTAKRMATPQKYPLISYPSEVLWMTSDIKTDAHLVENRKAWVECSTHSWLLVSHLI